MEWAGSILLLTRPIGRMLSQVSAGTEHGQRTRSRRATGVTVKITRAVKRLRGEVLGLFLQQKHEHSIEVVLLDGSELAPIALAPIALTAVCGAKVKNTLRSWFGIRAVDGRSIDAASLSGR